MTSEKLECTKDMYKKAIETLGKVELPSWAAWNIKKALDQIPLLIYAVKTSDKNE